MFKKNFKAIFVISGVLASVWKVFNKFHWHGQNTIHVICEVFSHEKKHVPLQNCFNTIMDQIFLFNRWDAFFCNGSHGRYAWVGLVRKSLGKPLWCRTKWKNLTWRKGHQKACLPTCWTWMMISGIFIWGSFYRTFYRVQTKHYQDYNHKILTIL